MKFDEMDDRVPELARRVGRRSVGTLVIGALAGAVIGLIAISPVRHGERVTRSDTREPARVAESRPEVALTPWVAVGDDALLREAVDEWIEATRRGDIPTQMRFYPTTVPVYYTWRNAPRDAVRAEKVKVFGAAHRLAITTDRPTLELAQDRRTATTRFRKQYVIEGPVIRRRGEVLQELRWTRTMEGWRIIGERDARVLRAG